MKKQRPHSFIGNYEYYLNDAGDLYRAPVSNVIASDTKKRHDALKRPPTWWTSTRYLPGRG